MPEEGSRSFTLDEVIALGFEAYHCSADGIWWLCHGCVGLRSDPVAGRRTLITDPRRLQPGPWHPTYWGERELDGIETD
jgi:hypothetical protein